MNCKDMMQIPELTEVLKLKAGKNGLEQSVRWIYFADCLQCVKSEYKIENYIHGDEFVVLTNPSVTDDSRKLMEMIRSAGMPMESIVSEALKIIKSLSGMSWKTAKPHSMIVVAYTAASFMVPIIRSGFPAP